MRHGKVDAERGDNRGKLCRKDICVLRQDDKGNGPHDHPENSRGGKAKVILPAECASGLPAKGDLGIHSVGSRDRECPCNDVRRDEWQVEEPVRDRKYNDVNGNIYDADRREAK